MIIEVEIAVCNIRMTTVRDRPRLLLNPPGATQSCSCKRFFYILALMRVVHSQFLHVLLDFHLSSVSYGRASSTSPLRQLCGLEIMPRYYGTLYTDFGGR